MSLRRSHILITAALVIVIAAVGVWMFTDAGRLPRIVSLLPASETIFYADIAPVRAATHFDQHWNLEHDAEYDAFIRATGIEPTRDLNEIALAVQGLPSDRRYTEVMRGKFDHTRLSAWLKQHADSSAISSNTVIYTITHEGRPVRVAILDSDSVAISNTNEDANILHIIDAAHHGRATAPEPLRTAYNEVPAGSLAWMVWQPSSDSGPSVTIGDRTIAVPFPPGTTIVASLRYLGALRLNATAVAGNDADAQQVTKRMQAFATLAKTFASAASEIDLKPLADSISVEQHGSKATLTAEIPRSLLENLSKLLNPPPQTSPATPQSPPDKASSAPKPVHKAHRH